jgi:hypothetical protein
MTQKKQLSRKHEPGKRVFFRTRFQNEYIPPQDDRPYSVKYDEESVQDAWCPGKKETGTLSLL